MSTVKLIVDTSLVDIISKFPSTSKPKHYIQDNRYYYERFERMMDILSLIIGFGIGVIVVGIAIEFGTKKTPKASPSSRPANEWSITEISNPKIMAEYLGDIEIPKNSKLLVNKYKDTVSFDGVDVRKNNSIKGNYILGDDRALILAGPIKKDEIGFWTVEKEIVESLHRKFDETWENATKLSLEENK